MKIEEGFWDSSAIVPLCLPQATTSVVRGLLNKHPRVVVWWGVTVEANGAFARLMREGKMTAEQLKAAVARLTVLRETWTEVLPSEQLRELAETLPVRYSLRAGDALQLAAALIWSDQPSRGHAFCLLRSALSKGGGRDRVSGPGLIAESF